MKSDNIFESIINNDIKSVYHFLKYELNDPNEKNDHGLTGLHICASHPQISIEIAVLLLEFGADFNIKDKESGWTPLHRALYFLHFRLAWVLIRAGSVVDDLLQFAHINNDNAQRDHEGLTPMVLLSKTLSSRLSRNAYKLHRQTNVLAFGKADYQLGVELPKYQSDVTKPKRVHKLAGENIKLISANKFHSIALNDDGEVFSWGHGRNGRLGHANELTQLEPLRLSFHNDIKIKTISAGLNHSLAISINGDIFSWGSDKYGQCGHGLTSGNDQILIPTRIERLRKHTIIHISGGDNHSLCCDINNEIFVFGSNKCGQLGLRPNEVTTVNAGIPGCVFPRKILLGSKANHKLSSKASAFKVIQLVASFSNSIALIEQVSDTDVSNTLKINEVYQWGNGCFLPIRVKFPSMLSRLRGSATKENIMLCESLPNIVCISSGKNHSVGVTDGGLVYTWGLATDQLGFAPQDVQYLIPKLVESLLPENGGGKMIYVSATSNRTCVVCDSGDLFVWGATNEKGILGSNQNSSYEPIPKRVCGIKQATNVATGEDHTLVVASYVVPQLPLQEFYTNSISNGIDVNEEIVDEIEDEDEIHSEVESKEHLVVNIPTLKEFCERRIAQMTDVKLSPLIFTFAEVNLANNLKIFAYEFIKLNFDAVLTQAKPNDLDLMIQDFNINSIVSRILMKDNYGIRNSNTQIPIVLDEIMSLRKSARSRSCSQDYSISSTPLKAKKGMWYNSSPSDSYILPSTPSKDLSSPDAVNRLIKATKKKLSQVQEIANRISLGEEVTKEQQEKAERKVSLEAELKRLEIIYKNLIIQREKRDSRSNSLTESHDSLIHSKQEISSIVPSFEQYLSIVEKVEKPSLNILELSPEKSTNSCIGKKKKEKKSMSMLKETIKIEEEHRAIPLSSIDKSGRSVLSPQIVNSEKSSKSIPLMNTTTPVPIKKISVPTLTIESPSPLKVDKIYSSKDGFSNGPMASFSLAQLIPSKNTLTKSTKSPIIKPVPWIQENSNKINKSLEQDFDKSISLKEIQRNEQLIKQQMSNSNQKTIQSNIVNKAWCINPTQSKVSLKSLISQEEIQHQEKEREDYEMKLALEAIARLESQEMIKQKRKNFKNRSTTSRLVD